MAVRTWAEVEELSGKSPEMWADEVASNAPISTKGMKWKLSCKRVGNAVCARFSKNIAAVGLMYDSDKSKLAEVMMKNRKLAPKSISLIYLRNPIYIFLFHWIFWRYIHWFKTTEEMAPILHAVLTKQGEEVGFFLHCMKSQQDSNVLQEMMSTQSITSIMQKHKSGELTI